MTAFALVRRDLAADTSNTLAKVVGSFIEQGFAHARTLGTVHWDLALFDTPVNPLKDIYVRDQRNFAVAVGTFFHGARCGVTALRAVLDEFGPDYFLGAESFGSFCLIVCHDGILHVLLDRIGVFKVYRDDDWTVLSSSFLALLGTIKQPLADVQSVYEYVFQGATYNGRTIVRQIRLLDQRSAAVLGAEVVHRALPGDLWSGPAWQGFDRHLASIVDRLRAYFSAMVECFADNIDTALSGGYDSRLLLALLRDRGAKPRVHVYGGKDDLDVRIAQAIASGEDFPLEAVDKSIYGQPTQAEFPQTIRDNFLWFDGYPADGIFDSGADRKTRTARARGGALALNGGGGEIFRNFFYLRDGSYDVRQILWAFFSRFDPRICTAEFSEERYYVEHERAIADLLRGPGEAAVGSRFRLSREEVELLYPCFRCTFWMGRNTSINNRFGYALTPFIEAELVKLALSVPIRFKNHGKFEAALIEAFDPRLASYPSAYGEAFDASPSLKRIIKDQLTLWRPTAVRRYSYRLQSRWRRSAVPTTLTSNYLATVIDPAFPRMSVYFHVPRMVSAEEVNRVATLEYLFAHYTIGG